MGIHKQQVDRLLDIDHASRIEQLEAAFAIKAQYSSLNDPNGFAKIERRQGFASPGGAGDSC
jgi:hypothetical protein